MTTEPTTPVVAPTSSTGFSCPLPQCRWTWAGPTATVDFEPRPDPLTASLKEGIGVWPSKAVRQLGSSAEESVHLHIDAHPLEDWLTALSIARAEQARALAEPGDEAWGAVWLYSNWRSVTREMGSGARELAAAAVLRWMHALDAVDGRQAREEPEELRWWTT